MQLHWYIPQCRMDGTVYFYLSYQRREQRSLAKLACSISAYMITFILTIYRLISLHKNRLLDYLSLNLIASFNSFSSFDFLLRTFVVIGITVWLSNMVVVGIVRVCCCNCSCFCNNCCLKNGKVKLQLNLLSAQSD